MVKVEVLVSADTTYSEDSKETESTNCFVKHRFEENNDKHNRMEHSSTFFFEAMHYARNLQISQSSNSR